MIIRRILLIVGLYGILWSCRKEEEPVTGPTPYDLSIPSALPAMNIPADNPLTVEGVSLGKKLFYDRILSGDNSQSCGSCHNQSFGFTDNNRALSIGIDQVAGTRNSMPLFNLGYATNFFWDGGATSLESQVVGPITNPVEMHEDLNNCVYELNNHPEYPGLFKRAFGSDSITISMVMKAIAQFERTLLSGDSKYDRWLRGRATLTPQEESGRLVYVSAAKGDCTHCHILGSTFSDFAYKNNGLDSISADSGRARITLNPTDMGKFKTPSMRNIAVTSPYMHDGRFTTLEQVVDHYNTGFHYAVNLDPNLQNAVKGRMSAQEMADLVAFLHTLTDSTFLTNQTFRQ